MVVCLHSTLNAFEFGVAEQPSMLVMLMSLVVVAASVCLGYFTVILLT